MTYMFNDLFDKVLLFLELRGLNFAIIAQFIKVKQE